MHLAIVHSCMCSYIYTLLIPCLTHFTISIVLPLHCVCAAILFSGGAYGVRHYINLDADSCDYSCSALYNNTVMNMNILIQVIFIHILHVCLSLCRHSVTNAIMKCMFQNWPIFVAEVIFLWSRVNTIKSPFHTLTWF